MITEKIVNGIKCHFNHDVYMAIRNKRHALHNQLIFKIGERFFHKYHEGNKIIEHELSYKVIRDKSTGELFIVTRVMRQFYAGWHISIQYDTITNSSGIAFLSSGTSIAMDEPSFFDRFEVTDITPEEFFGDAVNTFAGESEPAIDWFNKAKEHNAKVLEHFAKCK